MPNLSVSLTDGFRGAVRQLYPPSATSSFVAVAGTAYAYCFGRELQTINSLRAFAYTHGVAAAGAGWAEIAVATGTFVPNSTTQTLTYRAYADIDAEVKTAATVMNHKLLTASIPQEEDIWIVVASSHASTQASWRPTGEADLTGLPCIRVDATGATTRPSLNIGTARAFTATIGSGTSVPFMKYQVVS
jgi:hypothetical protein